MSLINSTFVGILDYAPAGLTFLAMVGVSLKFDAFHSMLCTSIFDPFLVLLLLEAIVLG